MKNITLRGHHLNALNQHYISGYPLEMIRRDRLVSYNKEHAERIVKIISDILANKTTVTFTDALDDICSTCPKHAPDCEASHISLFDQHYLQYYHLRKGKQYSAGLILSRLKKFGSPFGQ